MKSKYHITMTKFKNVACIINVGQVFGTDFINNINSKIFLDFHLFENYQLHRGNKLSMNIYIFKMHLIKNKKTI